MDSVQLAAVLAAVVLIASVVSVELGVAVALVELTLGVAAGNLFHLQTQEWLDFIAKFGSIVLTFLAGMEVDPAYMRRRLGASLGKTQFSLLVSVVVLSAVVPTAIAERWFIPDSEREQRIDRRLAHAESEEYV